MFYGSSDGPHTSCPGKGWDQGSHRFGPVGTRRCRKGYVSRATLRPDEFAGWRAPRSDEPAIAAHITTAPQQCDGDTLILSVDVHSSLGFVKAAIHSDNTSTAPDSHTDSNWSLPIRSNITDGAVSWAVPYSVVNRLRGKQVVIELCFNDAT
eukprot:SAG11_NODE_9338_length_921_cov_1.057178_2_plen_151_part_01